MFSPQDCVLRLFYSFYEIPPKVRKVESVTNVTEKISKNRLKDKDEEKSDKRDDDKKPKNKRERSKEKKQSKLSGKRKVRADGSASVTDNAVILAESVYVETVQATSVKCKDIDNTAIASLCSAEYRKSADPKVDRSMISNLAVAKCSEKGQSTFQSPTKQKPPPESSPSSIIANSSNKNSSKVSKGHNSKTSIKLLIKSSEMKDCKSQKSESIATKIEVKHDINDIPSKAKITKIEVKHDINDIPSNAKITKKQNGERTPMSKSNLFEKMSTLARSSEMEFKDLAVSSDSFSSQFQNKACNNNKTPREADFLKCDTKSNANIAKMNAALKADELMDKKNINRKVIGETVVNQEMQSEKTSMSLNKLQDTKPEKCSAKNSLEIEMKFDNAGKEHTAPDMKANKQDSKVVITSGNQSKSDCKTEIYSVKSNGTQGMTCNLGNKVTQNVQQEAHDLSGRTQDTNQNEIKHGQPQHGSAVDNLKENGFKSPVCDSTLIIVKTEPNSATEDVSNNRKTCDSINPSRSKLGLSGIKQISVHPEKNIAKRALEESKQNSKQNRDDGVRATSESKGNLDANSAVLPKANHATSDKCTVLQKIHNGGTKVTEITSVQSSVKMLQVQDPSASKAVNETAGKEQLSSSNKKTLVEPVSVSSQSENQQHSSAASQCSDMPIDVMKPVISDISLVANVSKPVISDISSVEHSVMSKIRGSSPEVNSGELKISSSKPAFVSGVSTTTTSSSPLPAPPKLLKTMVISTVSSSNHIPTSYSIASIVSVPVFKPGSIPSTSFTAVSHAPSSSPAANTSVHSKSCDVTSTVPHKAAVPVMCTTTFTRTTLAAPITSSAPVTTSASAVGSEAVGPISFPMMVKSTESGSSSAIYLGNRSESTTASSDASIKKTSICIPSTASLGNAAISTTASSIALPVTASTASNVIPLTTAVTTLALTVTTTGVSSWCTDTTINVANTFLNLPPKESPALKNTQTKSSSRVSGASNSNVIPHKEAIKLDNFLFDTKPSEMESLVAVSSHKVKDSCSLARQIHKGPLRTKSNSSAQVHGMLSSKSLASAESHITAVHHLPKTISHTSKPYSVAKSTSVSSASATKCNSIIQMTKISTLIPKSASITSKAGTFSKSFSYPSTLNSVPSSRSFLHTSLPPHMPRPDLSAVINGSSGYERAFLTKSSGLSSSASSLQVASAATTSSSHHRTSSKHGSKDGDSKVEKTPKNKAVPPLTIPKSCLTTLKLQRSPGSTDHYIFAPLSHYTAATHHNGERSKSKEVKYNGSRTPTSPPTPTKDSVFIGERQRVPTIKISDINRNPIIVESGGSSHGNNSSRPHSQFRSYSHGSSRSSSSDSGSARAHSRGGSDSNSPTGSSDRSDRSPARDARRPSDSELLLSQHWHGYSAADLLFNGFKLPPKFHDLHYDTDAMPLDYSQSSSKS